MIHNMAKTNVQLYTSAPPVELEVEERNRKDTLRAAAVSMAKDIYAIAQARTEEPNFAGPGKLYHPKSVPLSKALSS